jgi:hypothetical protein
MGHLQIVCDSLWRLEIYHLFVSIRFIRSGCISLEPDLALISNCACRSTHFQAFRLSVFGVLLHSWSSINLCEQYLNF